MEQTIVFVYRKKEKIKVLSQEQLETGHKELLAEGWEHLSTLDVCRWLEYVYTKTDIHKFLT